MVFRKYRKIESAITLIESLVAASMLTFFLAGVFAVDGRNHQLIKSARESLSATVVLEERVEQLRTGKWDQVTDSNYLRTILGTASGSGANLSSLSEQIVISAYPMPNPATTTTKITRSSSGTVTTVSSNNLLQIQKCVRADVRVTWTGAPNGRTRVRELSTIVANGGLTAK